MPRFRGSLRSCRVTSTQSHAGCCSGVREVERAGLCGDLERQAERGATRYPTVQPPRAVVGAGEVELAAVDAEWLTADTDADGRFADQAVRAAGALVGLRFGAQFDTGQHDRRGRAGASRRLTACSVRRLSGRTSP